MVLKISACGLNARLQTFALFTDCLLQLMQYVRQLLPWFADITDLSLTHCFQDPVDSTVFKAGY